MPRDRMNPLSGYAASSDAENTRGSPVLKTCPAAEPSIVLSDGAGTSEAAPNPSGASQTW